MVAKLWRGPDAQDMTEVEQFHHIVTATIEHRRTVGFLVRGLQPEDLREARPGVLDEAIRSDPRYRDAAEVVEELKTLDDRLLAAWTADRGRGGSVAL